MALRQECPSPTPTDGCPAGSTRLGTCSSVKTPPSAAVQSSTVDALGCLLLGSGRGSVRAGRRQTRNEARRGKAAWLRVSCAGRAGWPGGRLGAGPGRASQPGTPRSAGRPDWQRVGPKPQAQAGRVHLTGSQHDRPAGRVGLLGLGSLGSCSLGSWIAVPWLFGLLQGGDGVEVRRQAPIMRIL